MLNVTDQELAVMLLLQHGRRFLGCEHEEALERLAENKLAWLVRQPDQPVDQQLMAELTEEGQELLARIEAE